MFKIYKILRYAKGQIFILPVAIVNMNWLLLYNANLCVSISFCKIQMYLHFLSLLNNDMAKMIKMLSRIIQLTATLHRLYHGCQCLGVARNQGISNCFTYDIVRIILLVCSKYGVILCRCWVMQHTFSKTFHRIYSMLVRGDILWPLVCINTLLRIHIGPDEITIISILWQTRWISRSFWQHST